MRVPQALEDAGLHTLPLPRHLASPPCPVIATKVTGGGAVGVGAGLDEPKLCIEPVVAKVVHIFHHRPSLRPAVSVVLFVAVICVGLDVGAASAGSLHSPIVSIPQSLSIIPCLRAWFPS